MKKNIHIIDDNTTLAFFTARNIQQTFPNAKVIISESSTEAMQQFLEFPPDVMVVDHYLGDGEGLDLIITIKKQYPQLFPVLISGDPLHEDASTHGFHFLLKPYETQDLLDLITKNVPDADTINAGSTDSDNQRPVLSTHAVRNKLAGVLAGLRALESDIRAKNPNREIAEVLDHYISALCSEILEISSRIADSARRNT